MRKLPPLHALRAFEATARHASVTVAATELSVSHSAVSQQIKQLEQYFGQSMFIRIGRRVTPTPAAEAFLSDVKEAFDRIATGADQFSLKSSEIHITINTTPSFAMRWLIPATSQFQQTHLATKLLISTSSSDGIDNLYEPYDFIVRRAPMEKSGYSCVKLLSDAMTPLLTPSLLGARPGLTVDDLKRFTLLHMKSRPDAWRRWLGNFGDIRSDVVPGPFFDHFFLSLQAAINSFGVALGPLCLVEQDLAEGRLIAPFRDKCLEGPGFHLLYRQSTIGNRHRQAFLDVLLEEADRANAAAIGPF